MLVLSVVDFNSDKDSMQCSSYKTEQHCIEYNLIFLKFQFPDG